MSENVSYKYSPKYQDSVMYPHPPKGDISYPHCNKLRNKLVSQTNAEKLTENHLICPTCKTIQSHMRHHNKIDHLRASVYCLHDLRLNCGLVLKLEDY